MIVTQNYAIFMIAFNTFLMFCGSSLNLRNNSLSTAIQY